MVLRLNSGLLGSKAKVSFSHSVPLRDSHKILRHSHLGQVCYLKQFVINCHLSVVTRDTQSEGAAYRLSSRVHLVPLPRCPVGVLLETITPAGNRERCHAL